MTAKKTVDDVVAELYAQLDCGCSETMSDCPPMTCWCAKLLRKAYIAGVEYMTLGQDDAYRNFRNGYQAGRADAIREAISAALWGGCSCHYAPCAHDEAGEALAARIQKLEDDKQLLLNADQSFFDEIRKIADRNKRKL